MNDLCADIGYKSILHAGEQLCGDHVDIASDEYSTVVVLADGLELAGFCIALDAEGSFRRKESERSFYFFNSIIKVIKIYIKPFNIHLIFKESKLSFCVMSTILFYLV